MNGNKNITRLFDMDYDEVSVVDRPANQLSGIVIAKSDDDYVDVFDAEGGVVDVDQLEPGDVVYDSDGAEYMFVEDDEDQVDKALPLPAQRGLVRGAEMLGGAAKKTKNFFAPNGKPSVRRMAAAGAVGATGVGAGAAYTGFNKSDSEEKVMENETEAPSLGDLLLEELSKAANEDERQHIVAQAMNEVEVAKAEAAAAMELAEHERDLRVTEEFISKAAEYNVPVDPSVLGPILKSMAETLSDDQLDVIDALLTSVGDMLYDEIGYAGENDNVSVLDQVNAHASELVGKADVSSASAMTEIFESNPEAYEAYLAENGR